MLYQKEIGAGAATLTIPFEDLGERPDNGSYARLALFSDILDELPDLSLLPKEYKKPVVYIPSDFNGFYALRRLYQRFELGLPRDPYIQAAFDQDLEFQSKLKDFGVDIFGEQIKGYFEISERVDGVRAFLGPNPFFYKRPPDTLHKLLWFDDGVADNNLAWQLSGEFAKEKVSIGDYVIIKNPIFAQSAPQFGHYHVYVRAKEGYSKSFLNNGFNPDSF